MPRTRPPYSPEFRRQMVELVRAGRDPVALAHSDQGGAGLRLRRAKLVGEASGGSQYTSLAFGKRCQEAGVRPSMGGAGQGTPPAQREGVAGGGSVGDAYDNAMCDFFATLECELLDRRRFPSQAEARMACFSFIEGRYNPHRLHSALGYRSPSASEAAMETVSTEP